MRKLAGHCAPLVLVFAVVFVVSVSSSVSAAAKPRTSKSTMYYVSLGDSYSVGYQPEPTAGATSGYTGYVAKKEKLTLENFGCGGATTSSILTYTGNCVTNPSSGQYGPPAATDAGQHKTGNTQVQDAITFIKANPGHIGLITVSIGGNDVTACVNASSPISCVSAATTAIKTNVTNLAGQLRAAAGSSVPLIGLTYPDVVLGAWVYPKSTPDQSLAKLSITAFDTLINPALKAAYTGAGGNSGFVDVTSAPWTFATTGDDTGSTSSSNPTPQNAETTLAPYGKIPKAVAEICDLTYYCKLGNIHANNPGYSFIGGLIVKELPTLQHP